MDQLKKYLPSAIARLIELAEGVLVAEYDQDGEERVYQRPPDRQACQYLIDRVMGKTVDPSRTIAATPAIVRLTVNMGQLHGQDSSEDGDVLPPPTPQQPLSTTPVLVQPSLSPLLPRSSPLPSPTSTDEPETPIETHDLERPDLSQETFPNSSRSQGPGLRIKKRKRSPQPSNTFLEQNNTGDGELPGVPFDKIVV